jgi:hypothetical protein
MNGSGFGIRGRNDGRRVPPSQEDRHLVQREQRRHFQKRKANEKNSKRKERKNELMSIPHGVH